MTNIKLISILIIMISLFFPGCVEEKPVATQVPTDTPMATAVTSPTVVVTTAIPTPVPTQIREQKYYISYVDDLYGFYKVICMNGSVNYSNYTLIINSGDNIRWDSATKNNYSLTIVSQEGLWDNSSSRLRYERSRFSYTFNKSGEFEVYIDKFPKLKHQKIVVNP
jgi:outer membrane lipoprotein-sorting protein